MSTDKQAVEESADEADVETTPSHPPTDEDQQPSWWHRDHPTFTALSGFFTGLLFVSLIPAIYVGVLSLIFGNYRVEELFPFILVTLIVPLGLVVNQHTRRFGKFFWLGMVLTAVVVLGVAALVLWYLVEHQG
jgi:hypothetical protein